MKNKKAAIFFLTLGLFIFGHRANAEESVPSQLDYGQDLVLDSDLDGLTDKGEKEIFQTDPNHPDSDGDGFFDGAEVINGTDPRDSTSPAATKIITENISPVEKEASWPWYVARATGLLSFILLYIVMFLGLSIRTPILNKLIEPLHSLNIHAWLSVQALILVFIHMGALLFDKFLKFDLVDVVVPFASDVYTVQIAMGILAMYLMIILIVSSYLRKFLNYKLWRAIHFLNIALYAMAVYHSLSLGTDLSSGITRNIAIAANIFLAVIIIINLLARAFKFVQRKRQVA